MYLPVNLSVCSRCNVKNDRKLNARRATKKSLGRKKITEEDKEEEKEESKEKEHA